MEQLAQLATQEMLDSYIANKCVSEHPLRAACDASTIVIASCAFFPIPTLFNFPFYIKYQLYFQ